MPGFLVEFSNELADAVERAGQSVVGVLEGGRDGVSGTVWREGVAVTAEHTIRGLDEVTVVLPSGAQTKAAVTGRDAGTDVAVLKVAEVKPLSAVGEGRQPRVGEIVLSVGRRGGEGLAATHGLVSSIGGPWRTWHGARIDQWLRLDLNPFPGFSGGPIVNVHGEALGMATSGPRRSAVTIPAATLNRVVDQLLQRGRIARGYLGVGLQPVAFPEDARASLGIKAERGLLVIAVAKGTAAAEAGILIGDIVVAVEGTPVEHMRDLQHALDGENVGKTIALELLRGGKLVKVPVVVREKPER
jgi:S1-C subfamily serine protease